MVISCLNIYFSMLLPLGLLPPFFSVFHPPLKLFFILLASEKVEKISLDSFLLLLQVIVPRAPKAKWNKHRLWDLDGSELKPLLCLFPSVWFEASHLFSINLIWKRIFLDICEDDIWFTPRYYVPWRFFISLSLSFLILGKIKDMGGNKGLRAKSSYSLKDNIGIKYRKCMIMFLALNSKYHNLSSSF